jgi:hypothetical protein
MSLITIGIIVVAGIIALFLVYKFITGCLPKIILVVLIIAAIIFLAYYFFFRQGLNTTFSLLYVFL